MHQCIFTLPWEYCTFTRRRRLKKKKKTNYQRHALQKMSQILVRPVPSSGYLKKKKEKEDQINK
jgi:hypothetical protein